MNFFKKLLNLFFKSSVNTGGSTQEPATTTDEVDYSTIAWAGAPKCNKAKIQDGVQIGKLVVKNGELAYQWIKGGCENLGATSRSDCDYTQCNLGVKVNGQWEMRKFDWISTSRNTRGLEHCETGYNGFNIEAFNNATEYCFCITGVSKGKNDPTNKRTNVIYCKK